MPYIRYTRAFVSVNRKTTHVYEPHISGKMLWCGNGAHSNKILVNVENGETYEIDERCKGKLLPFQKKLFYTPFEDSQTTWKHGKTRCWLKYIGSIFWRYVARSFVHSWNDMSVFGGAFFLYTCSHAPRCVMCERVYLYLYAILQNAYIQISEICNHFRISIKI